MKSIISHILMFLIEHADLSIFISDTPEGHRIGGHDIKELPNKYVVMTIGEAAIADFTGYWQHK